MRASNIVEHVKATTTINGPCIEITLSDGTYMQVSSTDGESFPTKDDWCVGHYHNDDEVLELYYSKIYLWYDMDVSPDLTKGEMRSLISAKIISWGCESYEDGLNPEDTWDLMIKDIRPNLDLLTEAQGVALKRLFLMNVAAEQEDNPS